MSSTEYHMIKSQARSKISRSTTLNVSIEFEEICNICNRDVPSGSLVLRHSVTDHIICLPCLVSITEIPETEYEQR